MKQGILGYALAGFAGLALGVAGDRQYLAYQLSHAFSFARAPFAIAPVATFGNSDVVASKADGLTILSASFGGSANPMLGPPLQVSVKNTSTKTYAQLSFGCTVQSPDRSVPWASCSDTDASIAGGLAPGETQDIKALSFGGTQAAAKALKDHADATLSVFITDARGP